MAEHIYLHIDHLHIEGLSIATDEELVLQQAIESELARLITENRLRHSSFSHYITSRTGTTVDSDAIQNTTQLGIRIAQSIYEGMNS